MLRSITILRHLSPTTHTQHHAFSQLRSTLLCKNPLSANFPLTSPLSRSFSTNNLHYGINSPQFLSKKIALPPNPTNKLTVVLDMDETLLNSDFHSVTKTTHPGHISLPQTTQLTQKHYHSDLDFHYDIHFDLSKDERIYVSFRPGLQKFLTHLFAHYEPVLFTSATQEYAEPVLNYIETHFLKGQKFAAKLYRPSTIMKYRGRFDYVKDIRLLGRELSNIVLVDNSTMAALANLDNFIEILDYKGKKEFANDQELERVMQMLEILRKQHEQIQNENNSSSGKSGDNDCKIGVKISDVRAVLISQYNVRKGCKTPWNADED